MKLIYPGLDKLFENDWDFDKYSGDPCKQLN